MAANLDLADGIVRSLDSRDDQVLVGEFRFGAARRNELVFFFKPECFLVDSRESTRRIAEMVERKFKEFSVEVNGGLLLRSSYLERLRVMDRHYGYINRVSREASTMLAADERGAIREAVQMTEPAEDIPIEGGHEYLARRPETNEAALDELWSTKKSLKIRSGLYVQRYSPDGREVVLANGFHPSQLRHFTAPGRAICVLLLHSDTGWKTLRDDLVGNTFPEKAAPGSIRGELFQHASDYGMKSVSIGNNGVHLSAGPFEAAFEMENFLGTSTVVAHRAEQTTLFNAFTAKDLSKTDFDRSLTNPTATVDGRLVDLFTYTEDTDTDPAVFAYSEYFR